MLRCSHILCKVDDIHSTVLDYRELGFSLQWGSIPERAHNALLWFEQGPFVEFFELPRAFRLLKWPATLGYGAAAGERLARWAGPGEGWRDLALETDDTALAGVRTTLKSGGVKTSRVMRGRRTPPDGVPVRYQFLTVRPSGLPFVVSAYDPPQRPADVRHPNGAQHIATVRMGVSEKDRTAFEALIAHVEPRGPLAVQEAPATGVLSVEVAGLSRPLDEAKLHGAVLRAPAGEE
ncbi:VOC family protein [Streptomyces nanshensis]|uniref:Glyoxalase-like domain-containing protein n=1 Tax=Streptomyces nanshensis TaxID=518642 RepID=A0A1E7L9J6_9ACTN|nr:VOC family protein [Streptomyces nanshensis]OEV12820.1 hypothetical protein AN218_06280 [Streptomyces nanshensis]